ncbi:hypothetical protein B0H19DRAFT_1097561 [Mycena capillaripes]|nr:hypothetical protein B0H19DRAFT_1097561 [Mycena capillaripes]
MYPVWVPAKAYARRLPRQSSVARSSSHQAAMFILPAHAQPFDLAPQSLSLTGQKLHTWAWLLSPLRLPLTLAATLTVFLLVRAVLARGRSTKATSLPAALAADKAPVADKSAPADKPAPKSWLGGLLSWETLPPLSLSASFDVLPAIPIALSGPGSVTGPPPAMRGRHVYRGGRGVGFVRRPEAALSARPRIEAPLPAIYESQTPVSMAKMIMSRHTHRRPSPPAPRRSASSPARRPPSPPSDHARSASV